MSHGKMPNTPVSGRDGILPTSVRENRRLPRGSSSLPKGEVHDVQRKRILRATAKVVASKGYAATTISDIIASASVSRTTFYELFRDKEDCYLFGFTSLASQHLAAVHNAINPNDHLAVRFIKAMTAYINIVDADRTLAIAFISEAEAASPAIRDAYQESGNSFIAILRQWLDAVSQQYPNAGACREPVFRMLIAALRSLISDRARHGPEYADLNANEIAAFAFGALGLYGWANYCMQNSATLDEPVGD